MKKIFLLLFVISLGIVNVQAQLFWKVTGNRLKKPSYILGTHPIIPFSELDTIPELYKAFNRCNVVVSEFDLNKIDTRESLKKSVILPDKKTIRDYLDDVEYQKVDTELKSVMKIGLNKLSYLKPAVILQMYEAELFKQITKVYDDAQSDSYFQIVASKKDKKVIGLETEQQAFENKNLSDNFQNQAEMLYNTICNKQTLINNLLNFNKLYKKGDLNDLLMFSSTLNIDNMLPMFQNSETEKYTIAGWTKKLPDLMKENSCYITVSVLYLPGKNGLIAKLKDMGYRVKPVRK